MNRPEFLFLAVCLGASPAGAVLWPGATPCDGTLQACINGVPAGTTIELDNAVADENLSINKSLALRAAVGKTGVIGNGATTRSLSISGGASPIDVSIEDLSFDNARVDVNFFQGSGHQVAVRRCDIRNDAASNNTRGVDVDIRVPAAVIVEDNAIESNGNGVTVLSLLSAGTASALVQGNSITAATSALSHTGLDIDLRGAGTVDVDLYNNVIFGVAGCFCGRSSGIHFNLSNTVTAVIDVTHNTLDKIQMGASGFLVVPEAGVNAAIRIFNNIVTDGTGRPLSFPMVTTGLAVTSGFNNFFGNASPPNYGGYPPGAGVIAVDPLFIDPIGGDYHLDALSLAIDVGTAFPPGGLPPEDGDGNPRVFGLGPDLGAFEVPEPTLPACAIAVFAALGRLRGRGAGPGRASARQ